MSCAVFGRHEVAVLDGPHAALDGSPDGIVSVEVGQHIGSGALGLLDGAP